MFGQESYSGQNYLITQMNIYLKFDKYLINRYVTQSQQNKRFTVVKKY